MVDHLEHPLAAANWSWWPGGPASGHKWSIHASIHWFFSRVQLSFNVNIGLVFFLQREWWIRRSMALETSYQNSFEMRAIGLNVRPQSNSNFAPDKMTGAVAWTGRFLGIMRPPVWLTCTAIDSSWNALSDVFWVQSDRSQRSAVNSRKRNVTRGFSLTERNSLDFGATKRLNIAIDSSWKFLFTIFWLEFDQTKNSATNRQKWSESTIVTKKALQLINYNLVNFKFKACLKIPIDSSWKALFLSFWV